MLDDRNFKTVRLIGTLSGTLAVALALCVPTAIAQDPKRDDLDLERGRITMIAAGTTVLVRVKEGIDVASIGVQTGNDRIYRGVVEQDVRDQKGHIAIPRGSPVELKVRVAPDKDLVLDIESIGVNGGRYGVWADADRVEAQRGDSMVGTIVGGADNLQVQGRAVRVPPDTLLTFRIEHNMIVGLQVPDPGNSLYASHSHRDRN
jgi:hypothetical protein